MNIHVYPDSKQLGANAAKLAASVLNESIRERGSARIILSTGASQFDTIEALIKEDVDWSKVEMFHLDEYVDLEETHVASFRKYLKERFLAYVNIGSAHLVDGSSDKLNETLAALSAEIRKQPVDLALIGIGENAHIAFNDPPANFDTTDAYIVVELDQACKEQQVREGWFSSIDTVPKTAISMSVYQIMQSKVIVSCVPHAVKATAIKNSLEQDVNPNVPATMLKRHANWHLFLDDNSASAAKHLM